QPVARLLEGVERYLRLYGDRSANELKLEEPGMRDDPAVFFSLLRGTVERLARGERSAPRHPPGAVDEYLATHLRGPRRLAYEIVRRRVRHALTARERVRFCRTRIFGLARRMFGAIGADLVRVGALAQRDDVFFVRLEELR